MPKMKLNPTFSVLLPVLAISLVVAGVSTYLLSQDKKIHIESMNSNSSLSSFDLHTGEVLPDFTLTDLKGEKKSFKELKGKVTLINFWATWCGPCVQEMPSLNKLYEKLKEKGFQILAVNTDENPGEVLPSFLKSQKLNFPIFSDRDGLISTKFSISGLPFSLVVDRDGKILYTVLGEREWEAEESSLLEQLAK